MTCAGVSAGCSHDRHGERADQDASLDRHMTRSVAWWITRTGGADAPRTRYTMRAPPLPPGSPSRGWGLLLSSAWCGRAVL